jgi:hypothetical protein
MIHLFDDYLNTKNPLVNRAANLLQQATLTYQAGKMTKDEYTEVCNDLLNTDTLLANINDMAMKQQIVDAYHALSSIVTTIISL